MSDKFNWETPDDRDWERLTQASSPQPPARHPRWLPILAIVILIAAVTAYLVFQARQQIGRNLAAMRSDVASSYNLLRLAEEEQDDELFFSLLSGRDSNWTAAQHALFQLQSLHDRAFLGLQAQPAEPLFLEGDERVEISFSPDMLTAEVSTLLPFEISIGNGLVDTVTLRETNFYRLGRERWLLSPPDQDFWGPQETISGGRIELTYPQRDAELAGRLLPDLEQKYAELCQTLGEINCDAGEPLRLRFAVGPWSLVNASQPHAAKVGAEGLEITLPAPTLVGIPLDEAGYEALFRSYAAKIATAVIAEEIGYECCAKLPVYQALIDYQLSQLALKPWPVSEENYGRIFGDRVRMQDLSSLWRSDNALDLYGPDGWRVYTLVDYLLSILPQVNPLTIQRELVRSESFYGWLNRLFDAHQYPNNSALLSDLTRGFWLRGYAQAFDTSAGWGPEPPIQDLYITCSTPVQEEQVSTLFAYDWATDTWQETHTTSSFLWTSPLPGDDILLQQEFHSDDQRWNSSLRGKNEQMPLLADYENYMVSFGQTDPAPTGLSAFVFPPESDQATITWFDILDCQESSGCANRELPGIPIWSPDGKQALFTDDPDSQIDLLHTELRTTLLNRRANNVAAGMYTGDRSELLRGEAVTDVEALAPLGRGHAPFWIDNDTIGYVTGEGDPIVQHSSRVMSTAVDNVNPQLLFSLDDLKTEFEESYTRRYMLWIHYVMVHPDNPDLFIVVVFSTFNRRAGVLTFDRVTSEVRYLMSAGFQANHSLGFSPDGRFLVLTGLGEGDMDTGEENALLQVYDLERQEIFPFLALAADFPPFSTYDWSLDGNWLALFLDESTVGLFAPEQERLQIIDTPPGECGTPAWINR